MKRGNSVTLSVAMGLTGLAAEQRQRDVSLWRATPHFVSTMTSHLKGLGTVALSPT
jgi:hypothetical protein